MSTPRLDNKGFVVYDRTAEKIVGSFEVDAAPAVNIINVRGNGFVATVGAAGRYVITLNNAAYRLVSGWVCCECTSGVAALDYTGQLGAFTAGAGGVANAIVRTIDGGVETDIPVTDRVHFELTVYGNPIDA